MSITSPVERKSAESGSARRGFRERSGSAKHDFKERSKSARRRFEERSGKKA